jgi:hypothetical protein
MKKLFDIFDFARTLSLLRGCKCIFLSLRFQVCLQNIIQYLYNILIISHLKFNLIDFFSTTLPKLPVKPAHCISDDPFLQIEKCIPPSWKP